MNGLKIFGNILTSLIVWYGICPVSKHKTLWRNVRTAENNILDSLQIIVALYNSPCILKAVNIVDNQLPKGT